MKRMISLLFVLALVLSLALPVYGAELPLVIDNGNLLSSEEEAALSQKAQSLQEAYDMDVVILTLNGLGGKTPQDYADDYYDTQGYRSDGLLFLLSMEERDWYISTSGDAIYALTDYGIQQLGELALPYLSDGDYAGGFTAFLDGLPAYLDAYRAGQPIDGYADLSGDYYHGTQEEVVYAPRHLGFSHVLIALGIGLLVGGIAIAILRSAMNTKRPQRSASVYMDHYHLGHSRDLFLYSHVDRLKKPDPPQNNGGGGGGSSVHTSSSGSRHGGGGGKF